MIATDDGKAKTCPECDSADLYQRRLKKPGQTTTVGSPNDQYRCKDCGHTFDDPNTRERKHGQYGHQAKYAHLDAEDVGL